MELFLDMDGVITDFVTPMAKAVKISYDYPNSEYPFEINSWNFFPELESRFGVSFTEINKVCNHEFWSNLPWMFDGKELFQKILETLEIRGWEQETIYLLTSPIPNPGSLSGKMEWVQKNIPEFKNHVIVTSADKGLFARKDRILIDDKNENVASFQKNGGKGILVPRPWNNLHRHVSKTVSTVIVRLVEKLVKIDKGE